MMLARKPSNKIKTIDILLSSGAQVGCTGSPCKGAKKLRLLDLQWRIQILEFSGGRKVDTNNPA